MLFLTCLLLTMIQTLVASIYVCADGFEGDHDIPDILEFMENEIAFWCNSYYVQAGWHLIPQCQTPAFTQIQSALGGQVSSVFGARAVDVKFL